MYSPMKNFPLSVKLLLVGEATLILLVVSMLVPMRMYMRNMAIDDIQREMRSVAGTAALQIDADLHEMVVQTQDPNHPAFIELRDRMRRIAEVNGYDPNNIYTFFADPQAGVLRFGVMTHDEPFVGNPYDLHEHQAMAASTGKVFASNVFSDRYGQWIAAVAPIKDSQGNIKGLLEVARRADLYFARIDQMILMTTLAALGGLILASAVGYFVLRQLVIRPVRVIHDGMIALAQQDFAHRVDLDTGDELEELGDALNSMSDQLNVARSIQAGFVPQNPPRQPGYVFAYRSDPCDATGGDYIDAFDLPNGTTAILVADVTGHGLGPSLIMASCRSALRALAQTDLQPGELLQRLEQQVADDLTDGRFITMVLGVLTPEGKFTYANAGHAPAMIVRQDEVIQLGSHRFPLGIFLDVVEEAAQPHEELQSECQLRPGDRVVFTSDGVNETQDRRNEQFGMRRIETTAQRRDLDAHGFVDLLHNQITLHRGGKPPVDDITMLCVDRVVVAS